MKSNPSWQLITVHSPKQLLLKVSSHIDKNNSNHIKSESTQTLIKKKKKKK